MAADSTFAPRRRGTDCVACATARRSSADAQTSTANPDAGRRSERRSHSPPSPRAGSCECRSCTPRTDRSPEPSQQRVRVRTDLSVGPSLRMNAHAPPRLLCPPTMVRRLFVVLIFASFAAAVLAAAATSRSEDWRPWTLVALLSVLAVASEAVTFRIGHDKPKLTAGFVPLTLAMTLLWSSACRRYRSRMRAHLPAVGSPAHAPTPSDDRHRGIRDIPRGWGAIRSPS